MSAMMIVPLRASIRVGDEGQIGLQRHPRVRMHYGQVDTRAGSRNPPGSDDARNDG